MDAYRYSAAIVLNGYRAIRVRDYLDVPGMAGQRLIAGVIHDFGNDVIGGFKIRVHAGPLANRVKTAQYLETGLVIRFWHFSEIKNQT